MKIFSQESQYPGIRKLRILFSTHFPHSYAGGKRRRIYTGVLFRKVGCSRYDAPLFVEWIEFIILQSMVWILRAP
jgi:hypothetical protein